MKHLLSWLRKIWPKWVDTPRLNLSKGQTDCWLIGKHDSSVEVLWKRTEKVRVQRYDWMIR